MNEINISVASKSKVEGQVATKQKINAEIYPRGPKGDTGLQGPKGDPGNGIVNIEKTKTEGLIDTYTITFSDSSTFDFNVTNANAGSTYTKAEIEQFLGKKLNITDVINSLDSEETDKVLSANQGKILKGLIDANYTSAEIDELLLNNKKELQDNIETAIEESKKTIIVTEAGTDLNNYTEDGVFFFDSAYVPTNIPVGVNGWLRVLTSTGSALKQIWYRYGTNNTNDFETYIRTKNGSGEWSSWKKYSMEEDSGWLDLPLADGITQLSDATQYNCKYKKIGNEVHIIGCIKGLTANNTVIATLPTGYRPINTYRYITGRNASNSSILAVGTNGSMTFIGLTNSGTITDSDYVYIQTSFFVS